MNFQFLNGLRNPPKVGWEIDGKLIHQPFAYGSIGDWFKNFKAAFPERAEKMDSYSEAKGWGKDYAWKQWIEVTLDWLDEKAVRID